jgi:hypothetical protein
MRAIFIVPKTWLIARAASVDSLNLGGMPRTILLPPNIGLQQTKVGFNVAMH